MHRQHVCSVVLPLWTAWMVKKVACHLAAYLPGPLNACQTNVMIDFSHPTRMLLLLLLQPVRGLQPPAALLQLQVRRFHEAAPAAVPGALQAAVEGAGSSTVHGS